MNVTVEHIARIRAFLDARIKPLLDTSTGSRHGYAEDDASRGLRALTTVVMNQAAVATLIPGYSEERPTSQRYIEQAADTAWRSLCDIASGGTTPTTYRNSPSNPTSWARPA
ncbi:hypothetical protein [Streptomyces javensis]|uniref:Uncharacterized protein n=1 Tax=Streptomyces javensis TaxID=114698 RepID=A0ABS0R2U8_9ACTN|nr:hypothetical protein [Streptomyces javensis]MBI0311623.1 hypothetical protein [Streptomyces javensis]